MPTLYLSDGRKEVCPPVVTGRYLTELVCQSSLTLASVKPLNDGNVYRRYRFVGRDEVPYDLRQYEEIYTSTRTLLARIDHV